MTGRKNEAMKGGRNLVFKDLHIKREKMKQWREKKNWFLKIYIIKNLEMAWELEYSKSFFESNNLKH